MTRIEFQAILNNVLKALNLNTGECANCLGVSCSTLEQWKSGLLTPHEDLRIRIIHILTYYKKETNDG